MNNVKVFNLYDNICRGSSFWSNKREVLGTVRTQGRSVMGKRDMFPLSTVLKIMGFNENEQEFEVFLLWFSVLSIFIHGKYTPREGYSNINILSHSKSLHQHNIQISVTS